MEHHLLLQHTLDVRYKMRVQLWFFPAAGGEESQG